MMDDSVRQVLAEGLREIEEAARDASFDMECMSVEIARASLDEVVGTMKEFIQRVGGTI